MNIEEELNALDAAWWQQEHEEHEMWERHRAGLNIFRKMLSENEETQNASQNSQ